MVSIKQPPPINCVQVLLFYVDVRRYSRVAQLELLLKAQQDLLKQTLEAASDPGSSQKVEVGRCRFRV